MKYTIDLNNLDEQIANAPDDIELTPDQIEENAVARRTAARDRRQYQVLGPHTGWPAKYLAAVKVAPHGQPWLDALEVATDRVRRKGIVVLYGKRGNGKTRMAAELSLLGGSSCYRTAMRFFLEVRSSFRKDSTRSEMDILDELTQPALLVLDEIQERGETAFEDRLLTHIIDARYAAMRPTVLIANLTKAELTDSLGPSIVDRARENGKSIEFNWESYRANPET
jgi:DNA replication protein DnaC